MLPDRPLDPPDSYGKQGHYADLVDERKVRCVHDDDECSFAQFCPKYEPQDFFEFEVQEYLDEAFATCKLFSTVGEMEKEIFGLGGYGEPEKRGQLICELFKVTSPSGD